MKQENRPVFVADDGRVFETEEAALAHEEEMRKRDRALSQLKVYTVNHGFDATEGRGYFATTLVISDDSSAVLTQWCIDQFGPPLCSWYGDGFYEAWFLSQAREGHDVEWAIKHEGHSSGYGRSPWKLAVVSKNDFTWAGLPKSVYPWPRNAPTP